MAESKAIHEFELNERGDYHVHIRGVYGNDGEVRVRCGLYAAFADAIEKRLDDLRKASATGDDS